MKNNSDALILEVQAQIVPEPKLKSLSMCVFLGLLPAVKWVMEFLRKHFTALQWMDFSSGIYIMTRGES